MRTALKTLVLYTSWVSRWQTLLYRFLRRLQLLIAQLLIIVITIIGMVATRITEILRETLMGISIATMTTTVMEFVEKTMMSVCAIIAEIVIIKTIIESVIQSILDISTRDYYRDQYR